MNLWGRRTPTVTLAGWVAEHPVDEKGERSIDGR